MLRAFMGAAGWSSRAFVATQLHISSKLFWGLWCLFCGSIGLWKTKRDASQAIDAKLWKIEGAITIFALVAGIVLSAFALFQ